VAVKWDDYESGSETNPDRWNKMSILSGSELYNGFISLATPMSKP
jgi:hypothetical protein